MSKDLSQEAKEARNAYYREWRKKNPEKMKRYQENYWKKKAQEIQEEEEEKQANAYFHWEVDLNDETIN